MAGSAKLSKQLRFHSVRPNKHTCFGFFLNKMDSNNLSKSAPNSNYFQIRNSTKLFLRIYKVSLKNLNAFADICGILRFNGERKKMLWDLRLFDDSLWYMYTGLFLNRGSDVIFFSNVRIAKLFTSVSDFAPQGDDF